MKLYAHKPIPKTDVKIGQITYKCNAQGIVELPEVYKQFNPIEEVKTKKKENKNVEQD
jgi:hypothetical protein